MLPRFLTYPTGEDIRVGDELLYEGKESSVVFVIHQGHFSQRYPSTHWEAYRFGIGIEVVQSGMLYIENWMDDDVRFVIRHPATFVETKAPEWEQRVFELPRSKQYSLELNHAASRNVDSLLPEVDIVRIASPRLEAKVSFETLLYLESENLAQVDGTDLYSVTLAISLRPEPSPDEDSAFLSLAQFLIQLDTEDLPVMFCGRLGMLKCQ